MINWGLTRSQQSRCHCHGMSLDVPKVGHRRMVGNRGLSLRMDLIVLSIFWDRAWMCHGLIRPSCTDFQHHWGRVATFPVCSHDNKVKRRATIAWLSFQGGGLQQPRTTMAIHIYIYTREDVVVSHCFPLFWPYNQNNSKKKGNVSRAPLKHICDKQNSKQMWKG